jgi:hypothetical protein
MQATLVTQNVDMDPRIRTLVDVLTRRDLVAYNTHKKIAKMYFGELHRDYYLTYIARARKYIRNLMVSQNYLIVHIRHDGRWAELKYYAIGADSDTDVLFVNKVHAPPYPGNDLIRVESINDVKVEYVTDSYVKSFIFRYDVDVTDSEYTIDLGNYLYNMYRVQGDIVFNVARYMGSDNVFAWAREEILRYIAYLLADKITALLADYGISGELITVNLPTQRNVYAVRIRGGTDSSRWSDYSRHNRARIVKILSEYFDAKVETPANFTEVQVSDGTIRGRLEIVSRAYFNSHYGDIFIAIREVHSDDLIDKMVRDMTELFNALSPVDIVRNVGNHRVELKHVVPVSFSYTPDIKPLYLDPQAIYVIARNTFIVDGDSVATLIHKEHGVRRVRFAGKYVLNITTTHHDDDDVAYRNRVVLSRIKLRKSQ